MFSKPVKGGWGGGGHRETVGKCWLASFIGLFLLAGCGPGPVGRFSSPKEVGLVFVRALENKQWAHAQRCLYTENGRFGWFDNITADDQGRWLCKAFEEELHDADYRREFIRKFNMLLEREPILPLDEPLRKSIIGENRYPSLVRETAKDSPGRMMHNRYVLWIRLANGQWKIAVFDDVECYEPDDP